MKDSELVFSNWLKSVLAAKGLTGSELAQLAGISKASAYFYITGERIPSASALAKICSGLQVSVDDVPDYEARKVGRPATK